MEYRPRFAQPFTLSEAVHLDVAVITEEISRLQNSLRHLKETQMILESTLKEEGEEDPEIRKAFDENQVVIGSQDERISILKMALTEKGIVAGSHYDLQSASQPPLSAPSPTTQVLTTASENVEGDGIYLIMLEARMKNQNIVDNSSLVFRVTNINVRTPTSCLSNVSRLSSAASDFVHQDPILMSTEDPSNFNDSQLELAQKLIGTTITEINIRALRSQIERYNTLLPLGTEPGECSGSSAILDDMKLTLEVQQGQKAAILDELSKHNEVHLQTLSHFYPPEDAKTLYNHCGELISWLEITREVLLRLAGERAILAKEKDRHNTRATTAYQLNRQLADLEGRVKVVFSTLLHVELHIASGSKTPEKIQSSHVSSMSEGLCSLEKALGNVQLLKAVSPSRRPTPTVLPRAEDPSLTSRLAKINLALHDLRTARETCDADIDTLKSAMDLETAVAPCSPPDSPDLPPLRAIEIGPSDVDAAVRDTIRESFTEMATALSQTLATEFPGGANSPSLLYAWRLLEMPLRVIKAVVGMMHDTDVVMQDAET